jgi:hypothetical protein
MVYLNVNTAQTTLSGTDLAYLFQPIEGYRIARLAWGTANAQPITIGFWSSHHRPGLYSVAVRNTGGVRSYVASYTHNAADTSQYNVVTIPGDTGGTWASDNSFSFSVAFTMASGSTYIAPAVNTWYSANYVAAPGQVNGVGATTDRFRITGVTVIPGNEAPSAARSPFIMRPYGEELRTCQRYWENGTEPWMYLPVTGLNAGYDSLRFAATKRGAPTITFIGWTWFSAGIPTAFFPTLHGATPDGFSWNVTSATNFQGWSGDGTWTADARL